MSDPSVTNVRMSLTSASSRILRSTGTATRILHPFGRHSGKQRGHDCRANDDDRVFALGEIGIKRDAEDDQSGHDRDGESRAFETEAGQKIHGRSLLRGKELHLLVIDQVGYAGGSNEIAGFDAAGDD